MTLYVKISSAEYVPFINYVCEPTRDVLHGTPLSLEEWRRGFEECFYPCEADFIVFDEKYWKNGAALLRMAPTPMRPTLLFLTKPRRSPG